jgi:hypothetical protein
MKKVAWLCLIAAFGLSASCGDDGSEPSGPAVDEIPAMLAEALCEQFADCVGQDTLDLFYGAGNCAKRSLAMIEDGDFPYIEDAIDLGRVTYNPEKVEQCMAEISKLGCDFETTRIMTLSFCDEVLVGSLPAGADCTVDAECNGAAFCKRNGGCPGMCRTLLTEGEECDDSDDCRNNLFCSEVSGTCNAPALRGESCGGEEARKCKLGLSCMGEDRSANQAGTCKSQQEMLQGKEGESCNPQSGDLCDKGLSCALTVQSTVPAYVCTPGVDSGEPCDLGIPTQCPDGEYCSGTSTEPGNLVLQGTCAPLPGAGEQCASDPVRPEAGSCAAGLFCESDNKCHTVNRLGEPCVSDDGCASDTCKQGVCVRPEQCEL